MKEKPINHRVYNRNANAEDEDVAWLWARTVKVT